MRNLIKKVKVIENFLKKYGLDEKTKFFLENVGHNIIDLD